MPGDRVGVAAYLRVFEPTVDHRAVLRFLTRYRERHEDIEGRIRADFDRTFGFGSSPALSAATRVAIDTLFATPGIPAFKELPGAAGSAALRYSDLNYAKWTIADARRFSGEKHVVIVSERRLVGAQITNEQADHVLVRWASGARVAISYIHTGGLPGLGMVRGHLLTRSSADPFDSAVHSPAHQRLLAELTGGVSSFYAYASKPLDSLDRASRSQYLLGYDPKATTAPDAQRRIKVVVRRPGVTAMYRHAYQFEPAPTDEQDFRAAVVDERIDRALAWLTEPPLRLATGQVLPRASGLRLSTNAAERSDSPSNLNVRLALDPMRIAFLQSDGAHRATVQVTVLADARMERQSASSADKWT